MPYVIRKTDGTVQLILQDGAVDSSLGINLVGRSFTGYGELIAENFVKLLENFSNDTAPANAIEGQLWFDRQNNQYNYYYDNQWQLLAQVGATGPIGPVGPEGPQGLQGIEGPTGPVGATGPVVPWSFTGPYDMTKQYNVGDLVTYNGDLYYRIALDNTEIGYPPGAPTKDNDPAGYWIEIGTRGPEGQIGYTGSQGPTGPEPRWNLMGEYDNATVYVNGDLVTYDSELWYRTTLDNSLSGIAPAIIGPTYWQLIGTKGISGAVGFVGSRGVGFTGSVGGTGFTGSRGNNGSNGPQGDLGYTGSQGETGYAGSVGPSTTGQLNLVDQTISGTILNSNIVLNPLGDGRVTTNSDVYPGASDFLNLGASGARWQHVFAKHIQTESFVGRAVPTTSLGANGDTAGMIAFDDQYFYYCSANYNGTDDVWKRTAWSLDTW